MRTWLERRKWRSALVACLVLAGVLALATTVFSSQLALAAATCEGNIMTTDRVDLPGHLIPVLQHIAPLHDMDCNQTLQLTINLQVRNQDELNRFLAAQQDPASPDYHHYLTIQEYADRFGQPQAVVDHVVAFLQSQGFTVLNVAPNRLAITVTGTVQHIAQTFAVHLANFQFDGRLVFAPLDEPSVPASFGNVIRAITGLSNVAQPFRPK
jgi:kumamolisin